MRIDDPHLLSSMACVILSAPGWARVGITAPTEALREAAALELARTIVEGAPQGEASPDQLCLLL